MDKGVSIAAAARDLVGVRFRLQGRSAASGLDCVGLAALALGGAVVLPPHYGLRSGNVGLAERWLAAAGLRAVDLGAVGDLVLVRPGPLQLHLMVKVEGGHVHAHAGLRRVVEMPGASPWPVIGHWRMI
ncbi:peptidoglycan endopeptidase [Sphingobium aromaticiconvertens]|uniref:peptidoglycan endopeptidase n=1 Tax=Sphingobium aromaticiconvertens TaxID=365341 RepID=UPI003018572D